jgi:photosystem II P680 reaction center D1 protein
VLTIPTLVAATACIVIAFLGVPDVDIMLGVASLLGGAQFSAMDGSLVTSSLVRKTTETESRNLGFRFGPNEETYNIVAAHGYFGRMILPDVSFHNSRSLHFILAAWSVVGLWFAAVAVESFSFNLNERNFNQSVHNNQGRVIDTRADILNRGGLGTETMKERIVHDFPVDLATVCTTPVPLTARRIDS